MRSGSVDLSGIEESEPTITAEPGTTDNVTFAHAVLEGAAMLKDKAAQDLR